MTKISVCVRVVGCCAALVVSGVNAAHLESGLLAAYPFNESFEDLSGNGHDLERQGLVAFTQDRFGRDGAALLLAGDGFLRGASEDEVFQTENPESFTVSFWVNSTGGHSQTMVTFYDSRGSTGDPRFTLQSQVISDDRIWMLARDSGGDVSTFPAQEKGAFVGRWVHLVLTFDKANGLLRSYFNGRFVEEAPLDPNFDYSDNGVFTIGANYLHGSPVAHFNGAIDDVRIYDYSLSSDEVELLFQRENEQPVEDEHIGLVAHFPFDDGDPTEIVTGRKILLGGNSIDRDGAIGCSLRVVNRQVPATFDDGGDLDLVDDLTLSVWVKPNSLTDPFRPFLVKSRPGASSFRLALRGDSFSLDQGTTLGRANAPAGLLRAERWQHLLVTRQGDGTTADSVRFYVNGVFVGSSRNSEKPERVSFPLQLGERLENQGAGMDGRIDEIRIYDRVVSEREIRRLAVPDVPSASSDLLAYFRLNGDGIESLDGESRGGVFGDVVPDANRFDHADMAASFDGVGDFVDAGTLGLINQPFSIAGWYQIPQAPTDDWYAIFSESSGAFDKGILVSQRNIAGGLRLIFVVKSEAGIVHEVASLDGIEPGNWTHFVAVRGLGSLSLYVDGVLQETEPISDWVETSVENSAKIGRQSGHPRDDFLGSIDEIRIYRRDLSESEICDLYKLESNIGLRAGEAAPLLDSGLDCGCSLTESVAGEPPVVVAKDIEIAALADCVALVSAIDVDGGSAALDGGALVFSLEPSGPYPLGATSVVLTATDSTGRSSSAQAVVSVVDKTPPVFVECLRPILLESNPELCGAVATFDIQAEDQCASVVVNQLGGLPAGAVFPLGTTLNRFEAIDASGNRSSCEFTVTVVPEGQLISVPEPQFFNFDELSEGLELGTQFVAAGVRFDNALVRSASNFAISRPNVLRGVDSSRPIGIDFLGGAAEVSVSIDNDGHQGRQPQLRAYDLAGELIKTVNFTGGSHRITLEGRNEHPVGRIELGVLAGGQWQSGDTYDDLAFLSVQSPSISLSPAVHFTFDEQRATESVSGRSAIPGGVEFSEDGQIGGAIRIGPNMEPMTFELGDSFDALGDFTASVWVRPDSVDDSFQPFVVLSDPGLSSFRLTLRHSGFGLDQGVSLGRTDSPLDLIRAQTWHHLVFTRRGDGTEEDAVRLYVDGRLVTSGKAPEAPRKVIRPLQIGERLGNPGEAMSGLVDDLRLYDRVLSEAEVQVLANHCRNDLPIPNSDPKGRIHSPDTGRRFLLGETIPISVTATDSDGTIRSVTVTLAGEVFRVLDASPFDFEVAELPVGNHVIGGWVEDNDGGIGRLNSVEISVLALPVLSVEGGEGLEGDDFEQVQIGGRAVLSTVALREVSLTLEFGETGNPASATKGEDFDGTPLSLTIPRGESEVPFALSVLGDQYIESDEEIRVSVTSLGGATSGQTEAILRILNDDENTAPTIGPIDDLSLLVGEIASPIFLVLDDKESLPSGLSVTVESQPPRNLRVVSSDGSRNELIIPPINEPTEGNPISVIVTVTDEFGAASDARFQVSVLDRNPVVTITSPSDYSIVQLTAGGEVASVDLKVHVTEEPSPDVVFLEANGSRLLGQATPDPLRPGHYDYQWADVQIGEYVVNAVALDPVGQFEIRSTPIHFKVAVGQSEPLNKGEIAVVHSGRSNLDRELFAVWDYLVELNYRPTLFSQNDITVPALEGFRAIIWHDLGITELLGETVNTLKALQVVHRKPIYFVGEQVASVQTGLSESDRMDWANMTQLASSGSRIRSERVIFNPGRDSERNQIEGYWALVEGFDFLGEIGAADATEAAEVLAVSGADGYPLVLRYPSTDVAATNDARRFVQAFPIAARGDAASKFARRVLFENALCFLLEGEACECANAALVLFIEQLGQNTLVTGIGEVFGVDLELSNNGRCLARGAQVSLTLPIGMELLEVTGSKAVPWRVSEDGQVVHLAAGIVDPVAENIELNLRLRGRLPGVSSILMRSTGNNFGEQFYELPVRTEGVALGIIQYPDGRVALLLSGDAGETVRIEWAESIGGRSNWRLFEEVELTNASVERALDGGLGQRYFRIAP